MAQEMSWEVPESHMVSHPGPLAKAFIDHGFISAKAIWADATEEEQEKMEEKLWLPDELPTPILDQMPALDAARKSSVSATGMATALLFECAGCTES
eukprot:5278563-Karenia_brevis.AAC.1